MKPKLIEVPGFRTYAQKPVKDICQWHSALETVTRANIDAWMTLSFIWPRVMLRTLLGI